MTLNPNSTVEKIIDLMELKALLDSSEKKSVNDYANCLSTAANAAVDPIKKGSLTMLAHVCWMMLEPATHDGPFRPLAHWANGNRTFLPADLQDEQLQLLADCAEVKGHPDLVARLWDILWIRQRNQQTAEKAVTAYFEVARSSSDDIPSFESIDRLHRGVQLCLSLGRNGTQTDLAVATLKEFMKRAIDQKTVAVTLSAVEISLENHLIAPDELLTILGTIFSDLREIEPTHLARRALELQAKVYQGLGKEDLRRLVLQHAAETHLEEAKRCVEVGDAHHLARATFIESAILKLKAVPGSRTNAEITSKVEKLRQELVLLRGSVVEQMRPIQSPGFDISSLVSNTIKSVSHSDLRQSILALSKLLHPTNFELTKSGAKEILNGSVFSRLFPAVHMNSDGRVTGKESKPVSIMGVVDSGLWVQMLQHSEHHRQIVVQGIIEPATEWINTHHYISERTLDWLFTDNPMVPMSRKFSLTKGVLAGFQGDFLTATAILVPQFEHLLRHLLKESSVLTTNIDQHGVENEIALEALIELALTKQIIDELYAFDLRALLIEKIGVNLRNMHCHGLLPDRAYFSASPIYFWAMIVHWISRPHLASTNEDAP